MPRRRKVAVACLDAHHTLGYLRGNMPEKSSSPKVIATAIAVATAMATAIPIATAIAIATAVGTAIAISFGPEPLPQGNTRPALLSLVSNRVGSQCVFPEWPLCNLCKP